MNNAIDDKNISVLELFLGYIKYLDHNKIKQLIDNCYTIDKNNTIDCKILVLILNNLDENLNHINFEIDDEEINAEKYIFESLDKFKSMSPEENDITLNNILNIFSEGKINFKLSFSDSNFVKFMLINKLQDIILNFCDKESVDIFNKTFKILSNNINYTLNFTLIEVDKNQHTPISLDEKKNILNNIYSVLDQPSMHLSYIENMIDKYTSNQVHVFK